MISVSTAIESIIKASDYAEIALDNDVLNISAYARHIHKDVEIYTKKTVTVSSIVMALLRLQRNKSRNLSHEKDLQIKNILTRSELVELCYARSEDTSAMLSDLQKSQVIKRSQFYTSIVGLTEIAIVVDRELHSTVEAFFSPIQPKITIDHLGSLTLQVGIGTIDVPGQSHEVLKQLARNDISVVEYITSPTELNILVRSKDIHAAYRHLYERFM